MLRQTMGEAGPDADFTAYLEDDTEVFMLAMHSGGPLYVSQFDDGVQPKIFGVTAYPILGLLDPHEQPSHAQDLPDLTSWVPTTGIEAHLEGDTIRVNGDATTSGYQIVSPLIRAGEHDKITVRMPIKVEEGKVCAGALNGNSLLWLLPADAPRDELRFAVDATQGFRLVVANCNARADGEKSRFVLWPGTFLDEPTDEFYADRLVAAALHPDPEKPPESAGPGVQTFPAGLKLTKAEVEGPLEALLPADVAFRADIVQQNANTWTAKGKAQGPFTYLLLSKERRLDKNSRVLVAGRVEEGGISVGLLKNNQWAGQVNIIDPGDFTVVIAPASPGAYSLIVANNLRQGLDTSIALTKIGLITSK